MATGPRVVHHAVVLFTIGGIPVHPLLVHAVVVLVPLAALGAVAVAAWPSWSRAYGPLVAAGALAGALSATLAVIAGTQLEAAIDISPEFEPVIARHSGFGVFTLWATWTFAVLAVLATALHRRADGPAPRVAGALAAVAGIVALVGAVLAGHSGSLAVWGAVAG